MGNRGWILGGCLLAAAGRAFAEEPVSALGALFEEAWEAQLREQPLLATAAGDSRYNDRLPSLAPADLARRESFARRMLERLQAIDRTALGDSDRISYDMFERELRDELAAFEFRAQRMPFTSDGGFHTELARLASDVPLASVEDYENYIARLRAIPAYMKQQIAWIREGLRDGFTLPRIILDGYEAPIRAQVLDDPEQSAFFAPFREFPVGVPDFERPRLRAAGRAAVQQAAIPGYRGLLDFMVSEYIPGARATTGASELPNGRAYYEHLVRSFTTLEVTPQQVHEIGQGEVVRIRGEMQEVVRQLGFAGDFAAFLEFLRSDPRFYATTPEELLKQAAFLSKKMDARLPALFGKLPRLPYGVEPVPEPIAPRYTGGRYVPAPIGGTRAGTYWVNTYNLPSRPLYTLEALTLHEAVPGHHLQIALQQEMSGLPAFRRFAGATAFVEGWALYSERLGLEAGFYEDPYSNFGRLTYEMWRACRLVVDTGLHALGWSRRQARDFLAENTALSLHEIGTETDRYISWPGQALAYKMGELKIRELRRRAEEALGPRFDVRSFHDAVLANGPVPLTILEDQVRAYIAQR